MITPVVYMTLEKWLFLIGIILAIVQCTSVDAISVRFSSFIFVHVFKLIYFNQWNLIMKYVNAFVTAAKKRGFGTV